MTDNIHKCIYVIDLNYEKITCNFPGCKNEKIPLLSRQILTMLNEHEAFKRENEQLRERNEQNTYCAYCGKDFPLDIEHTTLNVGIHIWECEKHPLNILCERIEERCKDLDFDAQEHLASDNVPHASGIHKAIDQIRQEIDDGKQSCQRMRDALSVGE